MEKIMSFASAMLDYFGKNGKSSVEFMQEMKALTPDDRQFFRSELARVGYKLNDAPTA